MADKQAKTATINVSSDSHGGTVEGSHNGVRFSVPVGKDVEVSEGTLIALGDSGVKFSTIKPLPGASADEGSSADAATTAENTAIRLGAEDGTAQAPADREPHTLSQVTDKEALDPEKRQSANADTSDKGSGLSAADRGLATDTSSAKAPAKAPAKRASRAKPKAK